MLQFLHRHRTLLAILALTILVYMPGVVRNGFVSLDDTLLITKNPAVHGLTFGNLWTIFTSYDPELYVPLTLLTYQIEYGLVGLAPWMFHLTNLVLHLVSTALVFHITRKLARHRGNAVSQGVGFLCALLFALHPMSTQVIAWAAARKDALSMVFFLGSMALYLRYREQSPRAYAWSIVLFALGLLSKVSIVVLPLILLFIDMHGGRKMDRKALTEKWPYFALSIVFGIIALFGKRLQIVSLTFIEQALLATKATAFYLGKFFLPTGLSIFYPQEGPIDIAHGEFLLAAAVILALVGACALALHMRNRDIAFGIGWYVLLLLPAFLNFWKNGFVYFADDRYSTLPLIGISFAIATTVLSLMIHERATPLARRLSTGIAMALMALLAVVSFRQSQTWQSSILLYTNVLHMHPHSAHALNNLGSSLYEIQRKDEAIVLYFRAFTENPRIPQVAVNIGKVYYDRGDIPQAKRWFEEGITAIPDDRALIEEDMMGYQFLGSLLEEQGSVETGLEQFRLAVERGPQFPTLRLNYAIMLQKHHRFPEARAQFLVYLEEQPDDLDALYRMSAVCAEMGRLDEAIEYLTIIVDQDPHYERAADHLESIQRLQQR